jgi:adenylosuccinate synthase
MNPWQGAFRAGHFDFVLVEYALRCEPRIDGFVLTHLDRFPDGWTYVDEYRTGATSSGRLNRLPESSPNLLTPLLEACKPAQVHRHDVSRLSHHLNERFGRSTLIESYGPTAEAKDFTRIGD